MDNWGLHYHHSLLSLIAPSSLSVMKDNLFVFFLFFSLLILKIIRHLQHIHIQLRDPCGIGITKVENDLDFVFKFDVEMLGEYMKDNQWILMLLCIFLLSSCFADVH